MVVTAADDWEQVIAERTARRSARGRRARLASLLLVVALVGAMVASLLRDGAANAAHAALLEAPPQYFVAELRGASGPSDRASGVASFAQGFGVIEWRRTNYEGIGWETATFPTLGWEEDRAIYLREGEVRSWAFEDEGAVFFLERLLATLPELLAEAERVVDRRDSAGNGSVHAHVSAAVAERLAISSMPVTVSLDMRAERIDAMSMRWDSRYRPGSSISVLVDFGAAATAADLDRSVFAEARPSDPVGS
ncbi:MAG: hypothetical protein AAF480_10725 [Actinomycetota bacterium]